MIRQKKIKRKEYGMIENRLSKKIMNYRPIEERDLGRLHKRCLDVRQQNR